MGLVLLEPPAALPVSLAEALLHVRADNAQETALLTGLVATATSMAEAYCRRRFVTQRWRQTFDRFPSSAMPGVGRGFFQRGSFGRVTTARRRDEIALLLAHPPLVSVESVTYVDLDGAVQTMAPADYLVRSAEEPGEIVHAYGKSWPVTRDVPDAVTVEFTCGYGDAAAVPAPIKSAVLLIVGTLYANRETVAPTDMREIPHSAEWLLGPFRVVRFAA